MTFEDTITAAFAASDPIKAIVGDRVWFDEAPPNQKGPFVVCYLIASTPTLSTDNGEPGSSRLDNERMQVSFWARGKAEVGQLGEAIRAMLEAQRPTICIYQDERGNYDEKSDLRGKIQEYSCWHPGTVPA